MADYFIQSFPIAMCFDSSVLSCSFVFRGIQDCWSADGIQSST